MSFQFNEEYYLAQYPDVAEAVANGSISSALSHWQNIGFTENRNPNENFNTAEYLEANPDVADAVQNGMNPLNHFLKFGAAEGRAPSAKYKEIAEQFDADAYLIDNPDVADAIANGANLTAYKHWVLFGQFEEGRPEAKLEDGRTVNEVLNPETAPTLMLTESTDAAAAADAVASEYEISGVASATYANAATFSVTLPAAAEGEEPTELEIDVSAATNGSTLAGILNGNTAFTNAGLEASYSNGVLAITDAQGRDLSESISLVDAGNAAEPSTASVDLLQSTLLNVDTLRFTIGGEEVVVRGIVGDNGTDVASSIEGKIRAIKDADGEALYGNVSVKWDNDTLTIADDQLREFSGLTLLAQGEESSVAFELPEDLTTVGQLEITIDGVSETVDLSGISLDAADNNGTANNVVADAIVAQLDSVEGGLTSSVEEGVLTITDSLGRPFGEASQLMNDGDKAVASVTRVGPLTNTVVEEEVGQVSITVGDETIELQNVDLANMQALADEITGAFDADVTAEVDGDEIVITDAAGRGISDVYIGEAITTEQASTVEISGLTDELATLADSFTIKVGSADAVTINLDGYNPSDLAEAPGVTSIADLVAAINAEGIADVTAEAKGQTVIITDLRGRQLSEVTLTDSDGEVPSTATVGGLSDNAVKLDLGYIEVKYTDTDGKEQTKSLVINDDSVEGAEATSEVVTADEPGTAEVQTIPAPTLAEGQTFTLTVGGTVLETAALGATPDLAALVTAIESATGYADAPFTVAVAQDDQQSDVLELTWKDASAAPSTDTATLTADAVTEEVAAAVDLTATVEGGSAASSVDTATITFGDVEPVAGYVYSVTVGAADYSVTAQEGEDLATVLGRLATEVTTAGEVEAAQVDQVDNVLTLTGAANADLGAVEAGVVNGNAATDLTSLAGLQTAVGGLLGEGFSVESFDEDGTLVIQGPEGVTITSVSTLTEEGGLQVGDLAEIVEGTVREAGDDAAINLGDIVIENSEVAGNQPLVGVGATVEAAGSEAGINASQVGGDAVVTDAEETEVNDFGKEYYAGVVGGSDAGEIGGGFTVTQEGTEAADATAWTATLDVAFEAELEADYTFSLSLTEVLGEDVAEGTEAAVFNFTVDAVAGETSADVLANMAAAIDADEAFAAVVSEEGQLVVTAEAEATNYTVETGVELVAVEEPQIVEAA